jgi:hypothetical protein
MGSAAQLIDVGRNRSDKSGGGSSIGTRPNEKPLLLEVLISGMSSPDMKVGTQQIVTALPADEHKRNGRPTFGKTNPIRADEGACVFNGFSKPHQGQALVPKERMARLRPLTVRAASLRRKILNLL